MFERRFCPPGGVLPTIFLGMSLLAHRQFLAQFFRHLGRHDRQRARVCGLVPNAQVLGTDQFPGARRPDLVRSRQALGQDLSSLEPVKLWLILAGAVVGDDQNCIEHWVPRSVGSNFRTGCVFTRGVHRCVRFRRESIAHLGTIRLVAAWRKSDRLFPHSLGRSKRNANVGCDCRFLMWSIFARTC